MAGYIKLHRQLLDSLQFSNPNYLKVWVWMLLKAVYETQTVSLRVNSGYSLIKLERGQFIFGRDKAIEQLKLNGSMIYRILKLFENDGSISVKSNNKYSIITICNYDSYNTQEIEFEQPVNSQRTASEQPVNTYKKDKNVKNSGSKLPLTDRELLFIKIINEITKREFKTLDTKTRKQLSDISKLNYTIADIKRTISTALVEMKSRDKEGYLTPEFITRPSEFQKYVTMSPKQQNNSTILSAAPVFVNAQEYEKQLSHE